MVRTGYQKTGLQLVSFFIVLCLFFFASTAVAESLSKEEIQATVNESITAIFIGEVYSPALEKKQRVLRGMLEQGLVTKARIEAMMEEIITSLMNNYKTSRYILKQGPDRVNALFSPYMEWETCKEILWRVGSMKIPAGEQVVLKIGTLAPPGTPWLSVPERILIPRLARLSNNKFTIKIFGGGIMGEDTDVLRKMDIGQLDGCGCTALGILAASPETSVFLLPGMYNNYEEIDYISEKFRKRIDKAFEKRGYTLAALIDTGRFYLFSGNRISGLADLKKLKSATWFGNVETALYDELGINGRPIAVTETVSAFSTGMIDTFVAPAAWMLGMQAYQYVNFFIKTPLLYSPAAIVINLKLQDQLREQFGWSETFTFNVSELLVYETSTLEREWKDQSRNYEKKSLEAFVQKIGMKVIELSAEDRKALEQASLNVQEKLADKIYPRDLMEDIRKALKEYRSGQ